MLLDSRAPFVVGIALLGVLVTGLYRNSPMPAELARPHSQLPGFSGAESCAKCHHEDGLQAGFAGIERDTWVTSAALIPVAALGTFIGHRASPYIAERAFRLLVLFVLLLTGVYMTIATLAAW